MCQFGRGKEWQEFHTKGNGLKRKSHKTNEDIASLEKATVVPQNKKLKLTN